MANAMEEKKKLSVLVLMRYELERDGLEAYLQNCKEYHFCTTVVVSGYEAVQKVKQQDYDLLLLDYQLPDSTGDEIAKTIHIIKPGLQMIVITKFDSPYYVEKMKAAGVKGYIHKADDAAELIKAIDKVMKGEEYYSGRVYGGREDSR